MAGTAHTVTLHVLLICVRTLRSPTTRSIQLVGHLIYSSLLCSGCVITFSHNSLRVTKGVAWRERENGREEERKSGRREERGVGGRRGEMKFTHLETGPPPHATTHPSTPTQQVQGLSVPCIISFCVMSATILSSARPSLGLLGAISTLKTGSQCQELSSPYVHQNTALLYTRAHTAWYNRKLSNPDTVGMTPLCKESNISISENNALQQEPKCFRY